jgi:superfamily II DNA or RNA helicase
MEPITKEALLKTDPDLKNRPYQIEAIQSILPQQKCLAPMFCGTGKSRIITNVIIHEKKDLSVVVFPSLALIQQYWGEYIDKCLPKKYKKINISSLEERDKDSKEIIIESITDPKKIKLFLKGKGPKIVLVTYQSLDVLLSCLEGQKIGIICYDEAHHITSPEYQKLVFGTDYYEKEVFFTATPRNENGITMYDRDDPEKNMCGPVAYEYTYLQGLNDKVLNAFEICVDMYTENTNRSIYEAMARAILTKGTSRVLSFHSGVNGKSNTDVKKFVNEEEFRIVFQQILMAEFREKELYYKKITFKGMDGTTPTSNDVNKDKDGNDRKTMLKELDATPNNEIYIISSCETIGEGVDTKNANMCLFADPKSSITKIIQNIGRVVRRNEDCPTSTILIPCWINMENYAAANGDRAKQDEIIREQMRSEKGDYASILNVLGALRQEDPELYDMCLNYSDSREDVSEADSDEDYDEDEEETDDEETDDEDEDSVREADTEDRRPNNKRIRMSIRQNDDIQMLWGVKGELDFNQKFCSVVIDCEVSFSVEKWKQNLEKLKKYIDDNKKSPNKRDKNDKVKYLGLWTKTQNQNYDIDITKCKRCMKINPEIYKFWTETIKDERYADYLIYTKKTISPVENWKNNLEKLKKYIDENKKVPRNSDKNKEVKFLGNWMHTQKKVYKKKEQIMTNTEIYLLWTETITNPLYKDYLLVDRVEKWKQNLKDLKKYMDDNKKTPKENDINEEVKKLYRWTLSQKGQYERCERIMKIPEIYSLWTELINDLNYKKILCIDRIEQWKQNLENVKKYIFDNKKQPTQRNINKMVKYLGQWVSDQKSNYNRDITICKQIMKEKEIHALWTVTINDSTYKKHLCIDRIEEWKQMLEKVKKYIDEKKSSPSNSDKNSDIKILARWIGRQNKIYDNDINKCKEIMKKKEIHALWTVTINDSTYKKYLCIDRIEEWKQMLDKVKKYIDENNKSPSCRDKIKELKVLGTWISTQKSSYNRDITKSKYIMKEEEIHTLWSEIINDINYKKYLSIDHIEEWKIKLERVKKYVFENNKSPSGCDTNFDIKCLGKWIAMQKKNYKNCSGQMTNPEIYALWTDFINEPNPKPTREKKQPTIPIVSSTPPESPRKKHTNTPLIIDEASNTPQPVAVPLAALQPQPEPISPPKKIKRKLVLIEDSPKPNKSYSDLSEAEKQKICEKELKKRQEKKGYRTTNPDDKEKINGVFAKNINITTSGKILFLDHTEFKTAYALFEYGVKPEDMLIPQRPDNYTEMSQHELFGSSVVLGEFNEVLTQHMTSGGMVKGVYADYCSTLEKDGLPFIELLSKYKSNISADAVIGVTITLRNPEGVRYAGQDILILDKKIDRTFQNGENLFCKEGIIPDDGPYTYGNRAPMATWIFRV